MLDLSQVKLVRSEWTGMELPLSAGERRIMDLIYRGYDNPSIEVCVAQPLARCLKTDGQDWLLYQTYLEDAWRAICKETKKHHGIEVVIEQPVSYSPPKKADLIRFNNMRLERENSGIIEFVVLGYLRAALRGKRKNNSRWIVDCFTTIHLMNSSYTGGNPLLGNAVKRVLDHVSESIDTTQAIENAREMIEDNPTLMEHAPIRLFEHQRDLFACFRETSASRFVMYVAPTGTGKTLSPLGLISEYVVIFMCAARHVGLALARAAVDQSHAVAFAFGCDTADDIRLHFGAAKHFTRDRRTGGIRRVDNAAGDKVRLMICDVLSYATAMDYLLRFNEPSRIIWYWDEPTMTLDHENHPCHDLISKNWHCNKIPNVVLSSATLPKPAELSPVIKAFGKKFPMHTVHEVVSHDCRKSITVVDRAGFAQVPHTIFSEYTEARECAELCKLDRTLLRYVDLGEAVDYIMTVNRMCTKRLVGDSLDIRSHFPHLTDVTMAGIKAYYLTLMTYVTEEEWTIVSVDIRARSTRRYASTVYASSSDAHTLTDGPAIYLCEDTNKVGQFMLQQANVPDAELHAAAAALQANDKRSEQLLLVEKKIEDLTAKDVSGGRDKKLGDEARGGPELQKLRDQSRQLLENMQHVALNPKYVPNSLLHLRRFEREGNRAFTSDISEVETMAILRLNDVSTAHKLLLLLGIGVFELDMTPRYTEIMKELASNQKLYLIVASTDFIYGTNYQFCHGYLGADTNSMSREKTIQAMGRVGRGNCQQSYTVRLRSPSALRRLYTADANRPELASMIRLLN